MQAGGLVSKCSAATGARPALLTFAVLDRFQRGEGDLIVELATRLGIDLTRLDADGDPLMTAAERKRAFEELHRENDDQPWPRS
ncbi:MAG: hypothetical protein ACRDK7_12365 [Solirubrobacteraceae bacterium]